MANPQSKVEKEQVTTGFVYPVFVLCTVFGLSTWLIGGHSSWSQWTDIAHVVTGVILSIYSPYYLFLHINRTLGVRRPATLFSGLLTLFLFIGFVGSGWHIFVFGRNEQLSWMLSFHIVSALAFLSLVAFHLVLHFFLFPAKRAEKITTKFPSIGTGTSKPNNFFRQLGLTVLIGYLGVGVVTLLYDYATEEVSTDAATGNYTYPYNAHPYITNGDNNPFAPSLTKTSHGGFVAASQIAGSDNCLDCHEDIGAQWISSVHKQAAEDPTYVTNIGLLVKNRGIEAARYCEGCHAPVALLTGELSPGGDHGGIQDSAGNIEGVSCMSCHGVHKLVNLKGVASYEFKSAEPYLYANSDNPILRKLHNQLVRMKPQQHKKDLAGALQKDSKFCASCHTQFMDKDMNDWGWVQMQDQYGAWAQSPFSKQQDHNFSTTTAVRCQDCHMPMVESSDPSANKNGLVRSHHFPAANTVLPLLNGDEKQYQATVEFLQSNRMQLSIDKPFRKDSIQNLQALNEQLRNAREAPFFYYLGETVDINVVVSNLAVGHNFPAGTTDIGEAWVEALVTDAEGNTVFHSGKLDADSNLEADAYVYKTVPVDRYGNEVWRHDLFNMVGESFRRVVKSGGSDVVNYQFEIPAWAQSPLTLTATLKYRKLNARYARWALKEKYFEIPVIDMAWDSLQIPFKARKAVETAELTQKP